MQTNYNTLDKMKLVDLPRVPAGTLLPWLATKPTWLRDQIIKSLLKL